MPSRAASFPSSSANLALPKSKSLRGSIFDYGVRRSVKGCFSLADEVLRCFALIT
jgi:hypothetical protein